MIFVDDDATGANDGSSWCDAYVYLQDALGAVRNSGGSVAEIRVAQGTYRPDRGAAQIPGDQWATFELISGVAIRGGYAGCPAPDPDARDRLVYETILSGDLAGDDDTTLRGESNCCDPEMRDTPGCDDPVCQEQVCAGAESCCDYWHDNCANVAEDHCCELCRPTRCENSLHVVTAIDVEPTTVLDGFTVTGGERRGASAYRGAGLSSEGGSPTITNCRFVENAPDAMFTFRGEPRITNCDFIDNGWYAFGSGWALENFMNEVEIRNCRFIRNRGGGLRTEGSKPIVGCTFVQNTGIGGLYLLRGAPTISDCTFIGNEGKYGGGMLNSSGFPQLVNCAFYGNWASIFGGGLETAGSGLILINCVFSGNRAGGFVPYPGASPHPGAGGAVEQGLGSVLALGCTFVGNSAGIAGAMTGAGRADIAQCVFWENTCTQPNCGGAQVFGPAYFIEHSWIGGADPLFVDADGADDTVGTEDDNLRLSADSPLINAGDPDPPLVPYLDADGHERILCGRVDIGAYEFGIGDYDCNRVVELVDFAAWHTCMTGPDNGPFDSGCEAFDFDASSIGDIDLKDFAGFQRTLTCR